MSAGWLNPLISVKAIFMAAGEKAKASVLFANGKGVRCSHCSLPAADITPDLLWRISLLVKLE